MKDEKTAAYLAFWPNRGVIPSVVAPRDLPHIIAFFDDITPPYIKATINAKRIHSPIAKRTQKYIAALTKLTNVFHRNELNIENWEENKASPNSVKRFLTKEHKMLELAIETKMTISNFIKLIDELLQAYPDISISGYRVSQDLLERFICNMAPTFGRRSRSMW